MSTISIHTDGGARGNPGPSAAGFHIDQGESQLAQGFQFLGNQTNNYAEYHGVLLALTWLQTNYPEASSIEFYLDSQLVVRQLNKEYKIKEPTLQTLSQQIFALISKLPQYRIAFHHIPREQNKLADQLVNQCLDAALLNQ